MSGQAARRITAIWFWVVCFAACLAGVGSARGATPDDCHALRKHGRLADAEKCYESLTAARDLLTKAEGFWGLEQYEEANNQFRAATQQSPTNAMIRVRWGRLMHERFN